MEYTKNLKIKLEQIGDSNDMKIIKSFLENYKPCLSEISPLANSILMMEETDD